MTRSFTLRDPPPSGQPPVVYWAMIHWGPEARSLAGWGPVTQDNITMDARLKSEHLSQAMALWLQWTIDPLTIPADRVLRGLKPLLKPIKAQAMKEKVLTEQFLGPDHPLKGVVGNKHLSFFVIASFLFHSPKCPPPFPPLPPPAPDPAAISVHP